MGQRQNVDVRGLRGALDGARTVRVFNAGCMHDNPAGRDSILRDEPVLVLRASDDVAQLIDLLDVESVTDGMCMCPGNATFEFLDDGGDRLAAVGIHHGSHVRWSDWTGDAELQHGTALLEWLAVRGLGTLFTDISDSDIRRDIALAQQAAWRATVPECAQPLAEAMTSTDSSAQELAVLSHEVSQLMAVAFPDDVQRCRSLLAWFSAGTGACTAHPSYEGIPGSLITTMPIHTVLAALENQPLGGPVWAGGLRHIAGWQTRADWELRVIPYSVWDQLLEIGQLTSDPDKRTRINSKYATFGPPPPPR